MLFETLKKTLYAGVGLAFFTRDKLEEMGKRMAEDTARWGPIVKASGFKAD